MQNVDKNEEPSRYQHYLELRPKIYEFLKQGGVVGAAAPKGS